MFRCSCNIASVITNVKATPRAKKKNGVNVIVLSLSLFWGSFLFICHEARQSGVGLSCATIKVSQFYKHFILHNSNIGRMETGTRRLLSPYSGKAVTTVESS